MADNLLYFGDNLKVLREHVADDLTSKKAKKEMKKAEQEKLDV